MHRRLWTLFALFLLATPSFAGVEKGDGLVLLTAGYCGTKGSLEPNDTIDGVSAMAVFEKLSLTSPVSFGMALGYSRASRMGANADSTSSGNLDYHLNILPIYLMGRLWLGKSDIQPYVGLGLGIYFTTLTANVSGTDQSFSSIGDTGAGLGLPVGIALSLGDTLIVQGNYMLNWLWNADQLDNDVVHWVNVGIGFNLGM